MWLVRAVLLTLEYHYLFGWLPMLKFGVRPDMFGAWQFSLVELIATRYFAYAVS